MTGTIQPDCRFDARRRSSSSKDSIDVQKARVDDGTPNDEEHRVPSTLSEPASAKLTVGYIHIYDLFVKIITVSQYKNRGKYFYED